MKRTELTQKLDDYSAGLIELVVDAYKKNDTSELKRKLKEKREERELFISQYESEKQQEMVTKLEKEKSLHPHGCLGESYCTCDAKIINSVIDLAIEKMRGK